MIERDDLAPAKQQDSEQRALPTAAQRQHPSVLDHLERTKNPVLQSPSSVARRQPYHPRARP
jgi:hypothetical protein